MTSSTICLSSQTGISYNEKNPKWEYLLEGTIIMTNKEQFENLIIFTSKNHKEEFESILKTNEQLQKQSE